MSEDEPARTLVAYDEIVMSPLVAHLAATPASHVPNWTTMRGGMMSPLRFGMVDRGWCGSGAHAVPRKPAEAAMGPPRPPVSCLFLIIFCAVRMVDHRSAFSYR